MRSGAPQAWIEGRLLVRSDGKVADRVREAGGDVETIDGAAGGKGAAGKGAAAGTGAAIVLFVGGFIVFPQPVGQLLPLLIAVGLPWSHPLYFVSFVGSLVLQYSGPLGSAPSVLVALSVVANIVFAALLVWHPGARVKLVNWFFRLRVPAP